MSTMTFDAPFHSHDRSTQLRLTRRGRLVLFVLALVVAVGVGLLLAGGSMATDQPEPTVTITVASGDTLWAIASDVAGEGGIRDAMEHIKKLNDLDSGMVVAGQRLRIPVA